MKTIGLAGFFKEQIEYLEIRFKGSSSFIDISTSPSTKLNYDALICITETELDKLFLPSSKNKYKNITKIDIIRR